MSEEGHGAVVALRGTGEAILWDVLEEAVGGLTGSGGGGEVFGLERPGGGPVGRSMLGAVAQRAEGKLGVCYGKRRSQEYERGGGEHKIWQGMVVVRVKEAMGAPIPDVSTLFDVMHRHFSNAESRGVSETFLANIPQLATCDWPPISHKEILDMAIKTSNTSAPGPDNLSWHHIKQIIDIDGVLDSICLLFNNICVTGDWPSWFSESTSVIIPKPKKTDYTVPKAYRPIALLNTTGKLLTKIIAHRMQFDAAAFSLLHEGQCGGIQKHATIDAGLSLLDFINTNRERGWHVSVCAVDVAQFFPSINHHAAKCILMKLGFSHVLTNLIASYFTGRTTVYRWDSATSQPYDFNLGTPQGDCLSPILSALFLSVAIKHVFPHSLPPRSSRCLFFVDDGTLFTASPSLTKNVRVLSVLLQQLLTALAAIGLAIEPSKTELIHFFAFRMAASSRTLAITNQPPLIFEFNGQTHEIKPCQGQTHEIKPCQVWRYFDPCLEEPKAGS